MFRVFFPSLKFGTVVDKSSSYAAQKAATDGFIKFTVVHGQANNNHVQIDGYSDSAADPLTLLSTEYLTWDNNPDSSKLRGGDCFFVRKNDYWKIVVTSGTSYTLKVYWAPITVKL
jgi:hypothetical protein